MEGFNSQLALAAFLVFIVFIGANFVAWMALNKEWPLFVVLWIGIVFGFWGALSDVIEFLTAGLVVLYDKETRKERSEAVRRVI